MLKHVLKYAQMEPLPTILHIFVSNFVQMANMEIIEPISVLIYVEVYTEITLQIYVY